MLNIQTVEAMFAAAAAEGMFDCEYGCCEYTLACTDCIDTFEQAYDLVSD